MDTLISLLVGCFLLFVVFMQIDEYNKLVITKFKFRFFGLRDRLALLVVFKKLPEDSWEYLQTVKSLNFHISATEKLSLMRILEILISYHTSAEEERVFNKFSRTVDREDVRQILSDFFATTHHLIRRNSRVQLNIVLGVAWVIRALKREPSAELRDAVSNPAPALDVLQSHSAALRVAHGN